MTQNLFGFVPLDLGQNLLFLVQNVMRLSILIFLNDDDKSDDVDVGCDDNINVLEERK